MLIFDITFKHTHHHRVSDGLGDSNYSHSTIEDRTVTLVTPYYHGNVEKGKEVALFYANQKYGYDDAFEIVSVDHRGRADMIIQPPLTTL